MKTISRIFTAGWIVAAISLSACARSLVNDEAATGGGKLTLTATAYGEHTRIYVGESQTSSMPVLWHDDETLAVFEQSDAAIASCNTSGCSVSEDRSRATFSFSVAERPSASAFRYHALYPASALVSHDGTAVVAEIATVQHPAAASFDPGAAVMLASDPETYDRQPSATDELQFRFAHLTAYGKMTLTGLPADRGTLTQIEIETENTPLTGRCGIELAAADNSAATKCKSLTLLYDTFSAGNPRSFEAWFACGEGAIAAGERLTVAVRYSSGASVRRFIDIPSGRGIAFEAGTVSAFSIDMSAAVVEYPITIPEILDGITSTAGDIDPQQDRVLYAVVTSDAAGGNYTNRNTMIQTPGADAPGQGILLYGPTSANYGYGDLLRINLRKGSAKRVNYNNSGLLEITGVADTDVETVENRTVEPAVIKASELASYFGQAVRIENASSPAAGGIWCTTYDGKHTFTAGGSYFTVFVKKNAVAFVDRQFFAATGNISGYASTFNNAPQLCPNSLDDVATFTSQTPPEPADYIYCENFDGNTSLSGVWLNRDASWQNYSGTGTADIAYSSLNAQVRNALAQNYDGASGQGYAYMFGETGNHLTVGGIRLDGERNLRLSFGGNFTAGSMKVSVASPDRSADLVYTGSSSNGSWAHCTVDFTLTSEVETLTLKFTNASGFSPSLDDIRLEAAEQPSSQKVDLSPLSYNYRWAELPQVNTANSDWKTVTHWTTTVVSKKRVRNYTTCYDRRRHCPMWVAHTLHECYREGSGRSSTSSWRPDPYFTDDEQSIIYAWSDDYSQHQYWTNNVLTQLGRSDTWTRGHMLMSNYRPGQEEEINLQTFYSTNIAPQGFDAFSAKWLQAEERAMDHYMCSDTLYYVSGCHFADESRKEYDASNWGELSPASKECVVPTHFYKVLLRTRSGNTGKPIQECSADELQAVAIWFEHAEAAPVEGASTDEEKWPLTQADLCSVAELERRIGGQFTFFPEVPAAVKQSFVPSDWSQLVSR